MTSEAGWLAGRGRTSRRRRLVSGNVVGANGRARVGAQVGSLAGGASEKWEAAAGAHAYTLPPVGWIFSSRQLGQRCIITVPITDPITDTTVCSM